MRADTFHPLRLLWPLPSHLWSSPSAKDAADRGNRRSSCSVGGAEQKCEAERRRGTQMRWRQSTCPPGRVTSNSASSLVVPEHIACAVECIRMRARPCSGVSSETASLVSWAPLIGTAGDRDAQSCGRVGSDSTYISTQTRDQSFTFQAHVHCIANSERVNVDV